MRLFSVSKENEALRKSIFNDLVDMSNTFHTQADAFFLNADKDDIEKVEKLLQETATFIPILQAKITKLKGK